MKKSLASLILLTVLGGTSDFVPLYCVGPIFKPSEVGTDEDPYARATYETRMLVDPRTGLIPENIRERELRFSATLPGKRAYLEATGQRQLATDYLAAGPSNVGGRTRAAAFDVRNDNIILAGGVSGSMWKTTNGGKTWVRTSDPLNRNSVTALAQDIREGKEDIWYHGTGELLGNSAGSPAAPYRGDGIYRSTDGGDSWELLPATAASEPHNFSSQFQYTWRIVTNHTNLLQDEVLVATFGGILRSTDGGTSWAAVLGQDLSGLPPDTDLNCSDAPFYTEIQKTSKGQFFAALSSVTVSRRNRCENSALAPSAGFYFSEDGANWSRILALQGAYERTVIGFSGDESSVYFLTLRNATEFNETFEFFRYDMASGTWANLASNLPGLGGEFGDYDSQGGYNMVVAGHPTANNVVFLGGTNLYRSTTGFATSNATDWIGGYNTSNNGAVYPKHYPDQHLLLFYPSDPRRMISASDGGLRLTNNSLADSVSWVTLNNGYVTSQFYAISQNYSQPTDAMIGGMQDNGTYMRDAVDVENPPWVRILGGDGGYAAITPNEKLIYTSFQKGQVYRLTLNDDKQLTSYARVDPLGAVEEDLLFINPFVLDPQNPSRMFYLGDNVIWKNENLVQIPGGSQKKTSVNWSTIAGTVLPGGHFYSAISKSGSGDLLLSGDTPGGNAVDQRPGIVGVEPASGIDPEVNYIYSDLFPEGGHISCIAINPEDADHFLVIFSNYNVPSIFMTKNGGVTFTDISGNLEENPDGSGSGPSVRWGEIIPTTEGIEYYVGTSTGLYSAMETNGSITSDWLKESEDKIGNAVIPMIDYRPVDGRLLIATHGNGTFRGFITKAKPIERPPVDTRVILSQNFPNPFRERTWIEFSIPEDGSVKIDLYNSAGQLIKQLLWGPQFAGKSRIYWDGTNTAGVPVKPGVYYCVLGYGKSQRSTQMIYLP